MDEAHETHEKQHQEKKYAEIILYDEFSSRDSKAKHDFYITIKIKKNKKTQV